MVAKATEDDISPATPTRASLSELRGLVCIVLRRVTVGRRRLRGAADEVNPEEIIIARLFPDAVIFLESALLHYNYTDRIPAAWQIAVDRDSEKSRYDIEYPPLEPYYQEAKFLSIGVSTFEIQGVEVRIFDRERTICDIMRFENKIEKEVFSNAVKRYIKDPKKNIRRLFEKKAGGECVVGRPNSGEAAVVGGDNLLG